eukprot:2318386-Prymnesium_polylepis.1
MEADWKELERRRQAQADAYERELAALRKELAALQAREIAAEEVPPMETPERRPHREARSISP